MGSLIFRGKASHRDGSRAAVATFSESTNREDFVVDVVLASQNGRRAKSGVTGWLRTVTLESPLTEVI